jgi:hypothetical protein
MARERFAASYRHVPDRYWGLMIVRALHSRSDRPFYSAAISERIPPLRACMAGNWSAVQRKR